MKFSERSKFGLFAGTIIAAAVLMAAGVNGIFNAVTSTHGYQVAGGAGFSGQAPCSDGTYYDTPCTVPVTVGTPGTYASPSSVTTNTFGQVTAITAGTGFTSNGSSCSIATGCWTKDPLGHIHEWGHLAGETGGACNTITFPLAFTSSTSYVAVPGDDFFAGASTEHSFVINSSHGCAAPTASTIVDWPSTSPGTGVWWQADGY